MRRDLEARLRALELRLGAESGGCCRFTAESLNAHFAAVEAAAALDQPAPRYLEGGCNRTGGPLCAAAAEYRDLYAARLAQLAENTAGIDEADLYEADDPAPFHY